MIQQNLGALPSTGRHPTFSFTVAPHSEVTIMRNGRQIFKTSDMSGRNEFSDIDAVIDNRGIGVTYVVAAVTRSVTIGGGTVSSPPMKVAELHFTANVK
jgi:hypothetical protein